MGRDFEKLTRNHFMRLGIELDRDFPVLIGVGAVKKQHRFDLGSADPPILVECKSHTWTAGGNTPSAKMTTWNEAMYFFHLAPPSYRKALFVLKHERRGQSLGAYYVATHGHLIPEAVEVWELDTDDGAERRLR